MKRKEKQENQQTESQLATTSHFPRHANSGGAGLKDRATLFSRAKGVKKENAQEVQQQKKSQGPLIFQASDDDYINDNVVHSTMLKPRLAALVALIALLMAMNASAIITRVVMNVNDRALAVAMDISPDALAFAFNQMDIGAGKN